MTKKITAEAEAAMRRLREWIARSAGQNKRAVRKGFAKALERAK